MLNQVQHDNIEVLRHPEFISGSEWMEDAETPPRRNRQVQHDRIEALRHPEFISGSERTKDAETPPGRDRQVQHDYSFSSIQPHFCYPDFSLTLSFSSLFRLLIFAYPKKITSYDNLPTNQW